MKRDTRMGRRAVLTIAVAVTAGACSDGAGPSPLDEALLFDVAIVAADATVEDVTLWGQPFGFAPHATPGRPGGRDGWSGELSGTRSVTFFDVDGNEQDGYDPLTTDVVHILHEILGEVTREDWTASIHRERDMWVSGLAGEETHRTWNGSGSEEVSRSRFTDGGQRSYEASGTFAYDDVVVPIPGSDPPYPVSGMISRSMVITVSGPDGERTRTFEIVITFDGTEVATAVVNGETLEIDLSNLDGRLPVRRRQD